MLVKVPNKRHKPLGPGVPESVCDGSSKYVPLSNVLIGIMENFTLWRELPIMKWPIMKHSSLPDRHLEI